MKTLIKIFGIMVCSFLLLQSFEIQSTFAVVNIPNVKGIENASLQYNSTGGGIVENVNNIGFSILRTVKLVLQ